jgi:hypothetical protein
MIREYQNIFPVRIFIGTGITAEEYKEFFEYDDVNVDDVIAMNCSVKVNAKKKSEFIYTSPNIKKSVLIIIQEEDMFSMPVVMHEIIHNEVFTFKYIEHGISDEDESMAYYAEYLMNCYLDFLGKVKKFPEKFKVLKDNLNLLK